VGAAFVLPGWAALHRAGLAGARVCRHWARGCRRAVSPASPTGSVVADTTSAAVRNVSLLERDRNGDRPSDWALDSRERTGAGSLVARPAPFVLQRKRGRVSDVNPGHTTVVRTKRRLTVWPARGANGSLAVALEQDLCRSERAAPSEGELATPCHGRHRVASVPASQPSPLEHDTRHSNQETGQDQDQDERGAETGPGLWQDLPWW